METGGLWSMLIALVLLAVSAVVALWLLRRRSGLGGTGPVRVIQMLYMGPRERIVLIELEGRRHLIGVTAGQITWLGATDGGANRTQDFPRAREDFV